MGTEGSELGPGGLGETGRWSQKEESRSPPIASSIVRPPLAGAFDPLGRVPYLSDTTSVRGSVEPRESLQQGALDPATNRQRLELSSPPQTPPEWPPFPFADPCFLPSGHVSGLSPPPTKMLVPSFRTLFPLLAVYSLVSAQQSSTLVSQSRASQTNPRSSVAPTASASASLAASSSAIASSSALPPAASGSLYPNGTYVFANGTTSATVPLAVPYAIKLDGAYGVAGAVLILTGIPINALGGKNRWYVLCISGSRPVRFTHDVTVPPVSVHPPGRLSS